MLKNGFSIMDNGSTEELYEEALDGVPCPYSYEETVMEIPSGNQETCDAE